MDTREKAEEMGKDLEDQYKNELAPMIRVMRELADDQAELDGAFYGLVIGYMKKSVKTWPVVPEKYLYKRLKKRGFFVSKEHFRKCMEDLEEKGLVEAYIDDDGEIFYEFTEKIEDYRKTAMRYLRKLLESPEFAQYLTD